MKLLIALCLISTSAFPMKMDLELQPGEGEPRCETAVKYAKALTMLRETGIDQNQLNIVPRDYGFDAEAVRDAVQKKKTVEDVYQACLTRGPDQFVEALK